MYNKLFSKILFSSIWVESYPTRIVWVTFLAAMDEDGIVHLATPKNVAALAQVTVEEAERAIAVLEGPDASSSSADHDGRRIERFPGGWVVLNAKVYREMATREQARQRTAERVRKFRATGGGPEDKWNAVRIKALRRDDYTCRYCGGKADCVDHVVPVSQGGSDTLENAVAACTECNAAKGARTPEEAGIAIRPERHRVTQNGHRVTVDAHDVTPSEAYTETERETRSSIGVDDGFDAFWAVYPKKVAKAAALKAWRSVKPDADDRDAMLAALRRQAASPDWTKDGGRFVPHGATWLRGRRWEDEVESPIGAAAVVVPAGADAEAARSAAVLAERLKLLKSPRTGFRP